MASIIRRITSIFSRKKRTIDELLETTLNEFADKFPYIDAIFLTRSDGLPLSSYQKKGIKGGASLPGLSTLLANISIKALNELNLGGFLTLVLKTSKKFIAVVPIRKFPDIRLMVVASTTDEAKASLLRAYAEKMVRNLEDLLSREGISF
ncbi:MAG: hypothetical protein ACTSVW_04440 [Candidatus Njordarchaeales archaeon]